MYNEIEQQILWACQLEATARNPGNVHPGAAFDDLCYDDLVRSAAVVARLPAHATFSLIALLCLAVDDQSDFTP